MNVEQFRSYSKQGYIEWFLINIAFYALLLAGIGALSLGLVLTVERGRSRPSRLIRRLSNQPLVVITTASWLLLAGWGSFAELSVWALFMASWPPFVRLVAFWLCTTASLPFLLWGLRMFKTMSEWLRPKTLGEQLDEFQARERAYEQRLAQRADRAEMIEAGQGRLRIGRFIKGDSSFAEDIGIYNRRNWIIIDEKILDQHLFILGATGAGKSETLKRLIWEILVSTERDIYFVDGKGDEGLANEVRAMAQQHGRGLAPVFRMGHGQNGAIYDGFRGEPEDIYNRLVALVGLEEMEGAATYYADINRDLLQLICYAPGGAPRNFEQLGERLDKDWLLNAYAKSPHELATIENYEARDLAGLAVRLRPLIREFSRSVGEEGFALEDARCAIFSLRTQSVGDSARRFLSFLVEDLKDFIGKRQQRPAVLIIDEYAQFPADSVLALLSLARSSHLGVILATQDVSTLGGAENRQQILANTTTQLLMKSNFPEDIGRLAGTRYQLESSIQHDEGVATGMGSSRIQHAFKVDMNEVARLQAGEAFLIRNRYATKLRVARVTDIPSVAPQEPCERDPYGEVGEDSLTGISINTARLERVERDTNQAQTDGLRLEDL
ncbi:MAG: DUF87 domain-containing protein [Pseudomonadota bacterium]